MQVMRSPFAWLLLFSLAPTSCLESPDSVRVTAVVNDLAVTADMDSSVVLQWTAPRGAGGAGRVAVYDLRCSKSPLDEAGWAAATQATGEPVPQPAGAREQMTVRSPFIGDTLYFAIRSATSDVVWSAMSNVAVRIATHASRSDPVRTLTTFAYTQDSSRPDSTRLAATLHPDFLFHFTTQDAQNMGPGFPGYWTKDEFMHAMGSMFTHALSIHIQVKPTGAAKDTVACSGEPGAPLCVVYEVLVDYAVVVPREPYDLTYLVHGLADIALTQDPANPDLWVISDIKDRTASREVSRRGGASPAAPATEHTTWGQVLSAYR
jgi:hypothetical protein